MKELCEKLTQAAGCVRYPFCKALLKPEHLLVISGNRQNHTDTSQPESSGLHVHPLTEAGSELGDQISVISSEKQKKGGGLTHQLSDVSRFASAGWHADITFEPVPSDYAMLKIHTLPATGGDTVSLLFSKSCDFTHTSQNMADKTHSSGHPATRSTTVSPPPCKSS